MNIYLTKISNTHHTFEYVRQDGTGEKLTLETKTFLFHDFLHFAVESEAHLQNSFYGLLMQASKYADLVPEKGKDGGNYFAGEVGTTEKIVGPLGGVIKGEVSPEQFMDGIRNFLEATGETPPIWLTIGFIEKVREKMRKLMGEWNATTFGKTMMLSFTGTSQ